MVDDGSGDGTLELLEDLRRRYSRNFSITVIALKANSGPAAARNAGWKTATQPYVAWLDADDMWHPEKIHIQYNLMVRLPGVVMSGHPVPVLSSSSKLIASDFKYRSVSPFSILIKNCFPTPSVMLRRDVRFRFDERKLRSEDYLLWCQIICSGEGAILIDAALAFSVKAHLGRGGLSADVGAMRSAEIETYRQLCAQGSIKGSTLGALVFWSKLRHLVKLFALKIHLV
jgi:glycosyltransferase involved in cell wall biosynthesis